MMNQFTETYWQVGKDCKFGKAEPPLNSAAKLITACQFYIWPFGLGHLLIVVCKVFRSQQPLDRDAAFLPGEVMRKGIQLNT